jgi:hypothetical protein
MTCGGGGASVAHRVGRRWWWWRSTRVETRSTVGMSSVEAGGAARVGEELCVVGEAAGRSSVEEEEAAGTHSVQEEETTGTILVLEEKETAGMSSARGQAAEATRSRQIFALASARRWNRSILSASTSMGPTVKNVKLTRPHGASAGDSLRCRRAGAG